MKDPSVRISAFLDDALSAEEFQRLQEWLASRPDHLQLFVADSFIHSRLYDIVMQQDLGGLAFGLDSNLDLVDPRHVVSLLDEAEQAEERRIREASAQANSMAGQSPDAEILVQSLTRAPDVRTTPRWVWYSLAAVAATLMFMLGSLVSQRPVAEQPTRSLASAPVELPPIALVEGGIAARWDRLSPTPRQGESLYAGEYTLTDGVVELAFDAGATLVVQAPAAFRLDKPNRLYVASGRAVASVPPEALGFLLRTPAASFVDLGTEFGVEIDDAGQSSVHVLDGEIAVVQNTPGEHGGSRTVQQGEAQVISPDGTTVSAIPFDGSRFIRSVPQSLYELEVLRSHPLAYWPLQVDANDSKQTIESVLQTGVTIVEAGQGDGPVGYAQFDPEHDGIELPDASLLDRTHSFTCEAWAYNTREAHSAQRILSNFNRTPRSGFAFGLAEGSYYDLPETGLLVQFTSHGRFDCLSVAEVPERRWVHLAVVVDAGGTPWLFLNGERVNTRVRANGREEWSDDFSAIAELEGRNSGGAARIGRSPRGDDGKVVAERWLGRLSYVAFYDRALADDEIERHFAAGLPGRTQDNQPARLAPQPETTNPQEASSALHRPSID